MTRFLTTHRGLLRLLLVGAMAFAAASGCAKKKKTDAKTEAPGKTPVAKKNDRKSPEVPKVVKDDDLDAKKKAEDPPEKKVADKTNPEKKPPVAKTEPKKKKSDTLVPISKVTTPGEALAHIKALNPEITFNSLDEVQKINFEGTDATDAHLALLKYFPYISHLNLTGTKITDAGVAHLKHLERLSELFLYSTPITDAGVKHLSGLTRLEELCLDKTLVTDNGVAELKGLVELWRLHIQSRNKTTDAVFASLKDMRRLRELHIHGSGFSAGSVKEFRRQFPRCKVVWDPADPKKDAPDKPRKKGEVP